MTAASYSGLLQLALPEVVLTAALLAVLAADLFTMREAGRSNRRALAAAITTAGCVIAGLVLTVGQGVGAVGAMLVADPLVWVVQGAILAFTALTSGIAVGEDLGDHVGEVYALLLLAAIGMLLLVATEHLLLLFVALEMISLSLYGLVGLRKPSPRSAEAALKYFLFGTVASMFALFGFSLIYGAAGSLELRGIAAALAGQPLSALLAAALVMTVMGFGFKVAAVPFHLWAPDTYQGAPNTSAAFIASSSKVASFVVLAKVLVLAFPGAAGSGEWGRWEAGWVPLLATLALISMLLGNLAALAQSSVKRLLAYSAVAHAGYALVGIIAHSPAGVVAVVYYVVTYAAAVLGAFAILGLAEDEQGDVRLADLAGLSQRAPLMAACLLVFMLSLAGMPPLAGFYGKFAVFAAALNSDPAQGLLWLVTIAIAMSAVSLYYYLVVTKQAYVEPAPPTSGIRPASGVLQACVALLAAAVLLLGCCPGWLVEPLFRAVRAAGW
jgi:NADH-quinone oxidoreductase subunit N